MRIAILGATSQIAKDLILSFSVQGIHSLTLFARQPASVSLWLEKVGMSGRHAVADFDSFDAGQQFDAIMNFVGVGNPAQAAAMGASIFDITLKYDSMALDYQSKHPDCRYLFLSSGAAYGLGFEKPVDENSKAVVAINQLQPQNWYAVAKLHAECRHRSLVHRPIIDIRVFNYFSHTQDISARFLITDILRAIRDGEVLKTSNDYIVRDFLHPTDFHQLVDRLLGAPAANMAIDCYSKAPVDKPALLAFMHEKFGLEYKVVEAITSVNATGNKPHYYSLNRRAADFGFHPDFTALEGVSREASLMLRQKH